MDVTTSQDASSETVSNMLPAWKVQWQNYEDNKYFVICFHVIFLFFILENVAMWWPQVGVYIEHFNSSLQHLFTLLYVHLHISHLSAHDQ